MAHGLSGSLEAPDWPPLELDEVRQLLRRYPQAGEGQRIVSRSPRPFSSAGLVETSSRTVFIKRHSSLIRTCEELNEEHRFIEFLAEAFEQEERQNNFSGQQLVQAPLRDVSEETSVCLGEWTYEVHPRARGLDVYEQVISWQPFLSNHHAYAAGETLARLHHAAKGYAASARRTQQLVTSFTIFAGPGESELSSSQIDAHRDLPFLHMQHYLSSRPSLRNYAEDRDWRLDMQELFLPLYRELTPWLPYLEPLWTHNDFHGSNMMWRSNEDDATVISIVDFGLSDRTNAIHDLATAIERNIIEWLRMQDTTADLVHFDHLAALLDGYESCTPLSYEQARALAAILPLVHCEFALSETDYFLSVLHSENKAYLAYEGYFLGHAQWFLLPQGQVLLSWLREWAEKHPRASGGDH
ncbi:phosphotransferase enzyme family protein [Acidicapsa dinghuensis]|uniref:Phosphotransferase enzyme family protein n=1 Tax=Acidicapsa dinghuensis TaxID=2218256 RepID=A0ABW1EGA3_9BACT|nr:phosphotransferase [Acidicapsa dinghuensis]